jgi:shikimate dehydrogenase
MSSPRDGDPARPFLLLGDPVDHSWSPAMHTAALRAGDRRASYATVRCRADEVEPLMRKTADAGGGGNVTVPHKLVAAAALDRPSSTVDRTGACNTFWGESGLLCGENTDVLGIRAAVSALTSGRPPRRALVLGAGGAARAAAAALADAGCEELLVWNHRPGAASRLERAFSRAGVCELSDPHDTGGRVDVVVNATPLGLHPGEALPADPARIAAGAALDLVYARGGTRWVRLFRDLGIPAADGRGVLVAQAEAAFRLWWGAPPPAGAMESALPADA